MVPSEFDRMTPEEIEALASVRDSASLWALAQLKRMALAGAFDHLYVDEKDEGPERPAPSTD